MTSNMLSSDIPINPNCSMYYFWETDYGRSLSGGSAWSTYWVHSDVKDDPTDYNTHMKWKYDGPAVPKTTSKDTLLLLDEVIPITTLAIFDGWKRMTKGPKIPSNVTKNLVRDLLSGEPGLASVAVFSSWKYFAHPSKVPNTLRERMKSKRFLRTVLKAWKLWIVKRLLRKEKKLKKKSV